jgi:hypothetical protein
MTYRNSVFALTVLAGMVMAAPLRGAHAETGLEAAADSPAAPYPEIRRDSPAATAARDDPVARSAGGFSVVGPYVSIQVNVDAAGRNILGDAANEPSITVNPTNPENLVIGWRQFDSVLSNFRQAGWAFSLDAGQTWTFPGVLRPGVFSSDPVLDADSSGNIYYQSLREDFNMDVFTSLDGGMTWGAPVPSFGGDKNWMAVDKSGGSGDGHVYGIWQRFFGCCGQDTFTRSTDGALSFETPVEVAFRPTFGTMAVGPDGEVYAAGIDGTFFQNFTQFVIAKSTNAKFWFISPSFSGARVDMGGWMAFSQGPNPAGLLGQANVAVDASQGSSRGNVYLLASVNPPGHDPLDVHIIRSTDGGMTWSPPVRVNDDPIDPISNGAWQWFGAHSVAPNGRIDVVWNDTRNSGQLNVSELFYAYSYDGGDTWQGNIPVSQPFDSFVGHPNQNKIGDYYTLVSDETGANVAYAATFNGEQDVYFLRVFPDCNENGSSDVLDIDEGLSADINGNLVPDECELLLAPPVPGEVRRVNTFTASLGTPGSLVVFFHGFGDGSTELRVCGEALDMVRPRFLGLAFVDDTGTASINRFIFGWFSGRPWLVQAIEWPSCTVSNLVRYTFP